MPSQDPSPDAGVFERYRRLQRYVGWTAEDDRRVRETASILVPVFPSLIDDFYSAIQDDPRARRVITGGEAQIRRLKVSLQQWLEEFVSGPYDQNYAERRWRVGWRHVEIGLDQVYTNLAMSRLRDGMVRTVVEGWDKSSAELMETLRSINRLMDLDLALILDAYAIEFLNRERRAERLRGEAAFRQLVEAAGCMIVILRDDYSIAYFSPFASELTGHPASRVQGSNFLDLLEDTTARDRMTVLFDDTCRGQSSNAYELAVRTADGSRRWLVWNARRLEAFDGAPGILAVGHDVTERKLAEERALQSERLAAIGETVAGLAHESRNAFQRSQACLELLALELEERPDELELVARIQRALDHLHRLYEEVRNYAAPIVIDRQECDLPHLWRDAWAQLEKLRSEKSLELVEKVECGKATCHCDWFAMGQVFRNILENAVVACPEPGRITVSCRIEGRGKRRALVTRIRDNGPGIGDEARPRVFDAFFTTRTKGTGLGMAITRRIVEAHGGSIRLGRPSRGAEVIVSLPYYE